MVIIFYQFTYRYCFLSVVKERLSVRFYDNIHDDDDDNTFIPFVEILLGTAWAVVVVRYGG